MARGARERLQGMLYKPPAGWWEGLLLIAVGGLLVYSWSVAQGLPLGPRLFLLIAAAALVVRGAGELAYSRSRDAAAVLRLSALAGPGVAFVAALVFEYERLGVGGLAKLLAVLLVLFAGIAAIHKFLPASETRRGR